MAYQVTAGRFVGRTQELAQLDQLLAHASTGQPLMAVVAGELDAAELETVAGPARHELGRLLPDLAWGGEAAAGAAVPRAPAKPVRGGCLRCCWGWWSGWRRMRRRYG
jgi:hypothetical protein